MPEAGLARAVIILAMAGVAACAPAALPLLTTARMAHGMTAEEAARGYPVLLRAVVTYYDPYIDPRHAALFVLDRTGSIMVSLPSRPALSLQAGTLIEIRGVTAGGDFAPIVDHAQVRVIGESSLPKNVPRASLGQMITGEADGQWVEVEGVVHSVRETAANVTLDLTLTDGAVSATTRKRRGEDYGHLIDAKVRIHANVAPFFNAYRQVSGAHLFFPSMEQVQVEEPAAPDPFGLPVRTIGSLLRYDPNMTFRRRVHVRGRVTLQWPGRSLCIQDATQGLCAQTAQTEPVGLGALVDVAGFPSGGGFTPTMTDATFRWAGSGQRVLPARVTAAEALRGDHDSALVQVEGQLIGRDNDAAGPALAIRSGNALFAAVLPVTMIGKSAPRLSDGSTLRITGICSVQVDAQQMAVGEGVMRPASFRILLRSPSDVVTINRPSWWNRERALTALAVVGMVAMTVFAWVLLLRRRVREQTGAIAIEKERYRSLVDHAPDVIFASSLEGNLSSVNPAAGFLLGYTEEELLGRNIWDLLPAAQQQGAREHVQRLIAGESSGPLECKVQAKGGGTLVVEANLSIMREDGRPVAVHGVLRNTTERRRLEEQLLQAQKMEAVGRLAGGIAHDFNNLLTVINGYSGLALAHLRAGDPLRESVAAIRKAGERAAGLTRRLLAFSRKQVAEPRAIELNELILEFREVLGRLVGEDIEIVTELDPEPGYVMADPGQLYQVLMNLAVNARDAMPEGGRLTLRSSRLYLDETAAASYPGTGAGSYRTLEVSDTGVGMSEEIQSKLFEPFFTTKAEGMGSGLGLSTVYGIVRQAGGWIRAESQPGKGAMFQVGLPSRVGAGPRALPTRLPLTQLEGTETVLVVEDQEEVRGLAVAVLKSFGYRTLAARSGGEALLLAEHHDGPIHLMLTDVVMPGMTGRQLAERMGPLRPETKVLYMSGYSAQVTSRQGVVNPGIAYIEKPFTPEALALKVRQALGELRPAGEAPG